MFGRHTSVSSSSRPAPTRVRSLIAVALISFAAACGADENSKAWNINDRDAQGDAEVFEDARGEDARGEDATDEDSQDAIETVNRVPVSVETVLTPTRATAGSTVSVDCQLLNSDGERVAQPEDAEASLVYAPEPSFLPSTSLELTPITAGQARVACQFASLSLVDETPAPLEIMAGPVSTVLTELDRNRMRAGESVTATCSAYDAWGNRVEDAATRVTVDSSGSGISVSDHRVTITQSGVHEVVCSVDGADEEHGQFLEVSPGLPAQIAVSKVPDLAFYDLGQVVEIATIITDAFGNRVENAHVTFAEINASIGQDHSFGHGKFRFDQEGVYTVSASVDPPTHQDVALSATVEIAVNGQGPSIECLSPSNGAMLHASAGETVKFRGRVSDAQGVSEVSVNGVTVSVGANGEFIHDLHTRFGINFVDVRAIDAAGGEFGQENSATCAFLAADKWGTEDAFMSDAISLWLGQQAVDDTNINDPLDSLNDVLHTVLSSDGLKTQLHNTLRNQNPLTSGCYDLPWPLTCTSYRVDYRNSRIDGPHDTSLTLISNGLNLQAVIRNFEIELHVDAAINATGKLRIDSLTGDLDLTLALSGGRPTITLRPGSVQVSSHGVRTSINGLPGWLNDIISNLVEGMVQDIVETQVRNFLTNQLQGVLDSLVAGLDITALGSTFEVPRLDGAGSIDLGFGVNFSSLSVNATRALFGLATKFTVHPVARATPSLGVAMPAGPNLLSSNPLRPIAAGVHVGALNAVLHTLWRGGLFDATIASGAIGGSFPPGTAIELSTALPPVARFNGANRLDLMLGAMRMSIVYPGLFDEPVDIYIGALAYTDVDVVRAGSDATLNFSNIIINELYFSPVDITLDAQSRAVLADFLRDILQDLVDTSLNNALPALPIPSFTLPTSLNTYGLPGGSALGIKSPALSSGGLHLQIKGNFGVLP